MKIGLWTDAHNFPSLPLMKISAYHKANGDEVERINYLCHYDKVYASKVFSFTPDVDDLCMVNADEVEKGGSGYHIRHENGREVYAKGEKNLPDWIEHIYPDYGLYPQYKAAVGFLTRGCPRGCGFCIVGKKEGLCSHRVAELSEFWRGQKEIILLDPNLMACADHEIILQELSGSGAWVDFNQGIDVRFLNRDNIRLLDDVITKMIHFAWDNPKQDLTNQFKLYAENSKNKDHRKRTVYILTNYNSTQAEDLFRIMTVRDLGFSPYVMIFDKENAPREVKRVARWCNNPLIFRSCERYEDYDERKRYK